MSQSKAEKTPVLSQTRWSGGAVHDFIGYVSFIKAEVNDKLNFEPSPSNNRNNKVYFIIQGIKRLVFIVSNIRRIFKL